MVSFRQALESKFAPYPRDPRPWQLWSQAFAALSVHEPETVVNALTRISPTPEGDENFTYALYARASYFVWKCPDHRAKYCRQLLEAAHPIVQVAAAIYLSFDDSLAGVEALRARLGLPGFAGMWAAVALASRGDLSAMPRALDVYAVRHSGSVWSRPYVNLQRRLAALLSNSAQQSGVEAPPYWSEARQLGTSESLEGGRALRQFAWWDRVRAEIKLYDPWYPLLALQKVD
jgi:hypothetical protein